MGGDGVGGAAWAGRSGNERDGASDGEAGGGGVLPAPAMVSALCDGVQAGGGRAAEGRVMVLLQHLDHRTSSIKCIIILNRNVVIITHVGLVWDIINNY